MSTQQKPISGIGSGMKRSAHIASLMALLAYSALLLPGCSWGKKSNQPAVTGASSNPGGSWLCEAGKAADDWDCIQSENIEPQLAARNKAAAEARNRAPQTNERSTQETKETATETLRDDALPQNLPSPPQPVMGPGAAQPQAAAQPPARSALAAARASNTPRALTTASVERPTEPAYAQLAYRPDEPVRIVDLPENFYAAQLLAVSTKKQIEDFVVAQNLYNMSAARIEQSGQVLYVLLLGVYESKEIAQRAVASMPQPVQTMKPWVRPIEGLQDAMIRGDQLAATAGIQ